MLLAIDIGNTHITLGLWHEHTWQHHWRLATIRDKTADEYGILLTQCLQHTGLPTAVDQVILCSVVPVLTHTFTAASRRYLGCAPLEATVELDLGISVHTDVPAAVGSDRLVNAVAAHALFPGPTLVVDMGTATKLDVVTSTGALVGGAIAPGLQLAADALAGRAARLHQVNLEAPPHVLGRNTVHAMQSGLIFGYVSLVEGLIRRLQAAHPDQSAPARVIGTGGLIGLITPHTNLIQHVDPWLTLTGLRLIHERLAGQGAAA
ncbi:MAG: type III pantothenate kinase [Anaerolineales bacterium]|nr:type III pantothenate kinase [Anaerolineales bacterium]